MPYQLHFIADNQVAFVKVIGTYSLEDVRTLSAEIVAFMDTSGLDCYILADIRQMRTMPTNIVQMREAGRQMLTHPRFKMLLSFGSQDILVVNFMVRTLGTLFGINVQTFLEASRAIEYLINHAPHLAIPLESDLNYLNSNAVLY